MLEIIEEYGGFTLAIISGSFMIGIVMILFLDEVSGDVSITSYVAQYMEQLLG